MSVFPIAALIVLTMLGGLVVVSVAEKITPAKTPGVAKSASTLSLLVWWWTGGARRLKAARLRRQGDHLRALILVTGDSSIIFEAIRVVPDVDERQEYYKTLSRWATSPNRK
jgi:hypothetical protein